MLLRLTKKKKKKKRIRNEDLILKMATRFVYLYPFTSNVELRERSATKEVMLRFTHAKA